MTPPVLQHFSPKRLFSKNLFLPTLICLFFYFISGLSAWHHFKSQIDRLALSSSQVQAVLHSFQTSLAIYFFAISLILFIFSLILAKQLIFPVQKMLAQARDVLLLNSNPDKPPIDTLDQNSDGQWSALESSIEEIRRNLESKIENLTLEREEQATLMSAISDAILAIDLEGAPLFYNSRFALLFGGKGLNAKKKVWEIFKDPEILEAFRYAIHEGKSAAVKAIPFDLPTRRFFSVSISPLRKGKESIYGVVGIFHDVTELKRAEQMRIDFVANVSHELRTPLTAIKGYADTLILDNKEGNPPCPEFLEIIARNTDRLMHLINDLLNLSSLESKDDVQKSLLSTEEVTSRVIRQMKGVFDSKRQEVYVESRVSQVLADPTRIEQVLVNLLDNANKYTPTDGKISVHWETSSNQTTILRIRDSGPGIPAEHHSRLFERFYRVDKARSREQGGTGLGLAIVKHIMQRHDGNISVESVPGNGSTFICEFPG